MYTDKEIEELTRKDHKASDKEDIIKELIVERRLNKENTREMFKWQREAERWKWNAIALGVLLIIIVVFMIAKNFGVNIGGCPYILPECD